MLFYKKENRFPYALRVNTSLRYRCVYDKKKVLKKEKLEKFQKKKKTVALLCKDYMQSNASEESFQSRL